MAWTFGAVLFGVAFIVAAAYRDSAARSERIEHKLNLLLRYADIDPLEPMPLSERVKAIANDPARTVEAIKIYRDETGEGLAAAKDAVERYVRRGVGPG
jgi:ribosomal protein L7/L12